MDFLWSSVAAFCTVAVLSFLYKDNPFYKFAEHLFVGVAAGYVVCTEFYNVILPNLWRPLSTGQNYFLLIPLLMGAALFTRFSSGLSWISRYPMSLIIGVYAGLAVIGFASGDLVLQVQASLIPVISVPSIEHFAGNPGALTFLGMLDNPTFTIGLVCVLFYFFFSIEQRGPLRYAAIGGTALLMVGFGAGYGYTVMNRIALLFDRLYFLMVEYLKVATV
ncbi:hypothetical protein HZB60_05835 [candidate division KSB1 bacterium]|nr:hypothetical protein [candidate division KSB1 bacterium]